MWFAWLAFWVVLFGAVSMVVIMVRAATGLVADYHNLNKPSDQRRCVMCNGVLLKQDESEKWKGAHSWCETYH